MPQEMGTGHLFHISLSNPRKNEKGKIHLLIESKVNLFSQGKVVTDQKTYQINTDRNILGLREQHTTGRLHNSTEKSEHGQPLM